MQARAARAWSRTAGWPEDGYRGDYIEDVARAYLARETVHADGHDVTGAGDVDDLEAIRQFAVAYLRREQDLDLKAFGVAFDVYFLESSLYTDGKVEETVKANWSRTATPTRRTAPCGCRPRISATTKTG